MKREDEKDEEREEDEDEEKRFTRKGSHMVLSTRKEPSCLVMDGFTVCLVSIKTME